ncbi:hypothetical protein PV797_11945 [Clostridiaceae bacterium M8S5]|nr:hypothetical protein PV797_11945 [Clostridiaceae bacterium M8S5]
MLHKNKKIIIAVLVIVCIVLIAYKVHSPNLKSEFGIYLLQDDIPLEQLLKTDVSDIKIMKEPLLSVKDFVYYKWQDHSFELTTDAKEMILSRKEDLYRKPFVVVVNGENMYAGVFSLMTSSYAYPIPTILIEKPCLNRIIRGVSKSEQDPRNRQEIKNVLEQHGILK